MNLPIYQVDAFTHLLFGGNPAAVVILNEWIDAEIMQKIGLENNLAETAFIVKNGDSYDIRWFTPAVEVELCGHATLASAYVIFNFLNPQATQVRFTSIFSGELRVTKHNDWYELDFPIDELNEQKGPLPADLLLGIGKEPLEFFKGKTDCLLVFGSQNEIESITPDFNRLARSSSRGIIVTAPGEKTDFVSRFFAPQAGINEDPVTGSAHTSLIPYWHQKTGKTSFSAAQLSKRGGFLKCEYAGTRVKISGEARLFFKGEIYLD